MMMEQTIAMDAEKADKGEAMPEFHSVHKLRRQYLDYLSLKRDEMDEQREARHYYHGDQWTVEEIKELRKRKQPKVTYNRIASKVNGVVGLLERLKQDPKAYPRTPRHAEGADLATACLRYATEASKWGDIAPAAARTAAIDGMAGIEIEMIQHRSGERDFRIHPVDMDCFFYDPRSFKHDFSDARFMGVAKWMDEDAVEAMFPDKEEEIDALMAMGAEYGAGDRDRERKWVDSDRKRLRIVEQWYLCDGEWMWCFYCGDVKLDEGVSYILDEEDKTLPRFFMFSANVDHDGDRYGFHRNLKSPQDEVNHRISKSLHLLNSRRVIMEEGAVSDIERMRKEANRPDGVIVKTPGLELTFEDQKTQVDMASNLKLLDNARSEIENFGPNPALVGTGLENKSGRAISLLQQAGIAELGPYIIQYREWKIRVYRAVWNMIQRCWTAEKWIRVTDSDGLAQFIQVNGVEVDPMTGMPTLVNAIGQLDIDIILDEGPDSINMAADAYDALTALAQAGERLPPGLLIELAPGIPQDVKKKYLDELQSMQQPNPLQAKGAEIELAGKAAQVDKTRAETGRIVAETNKSHAETMLTAFQPVQAPVLGPSEQAFMR